MLATLPEHPGFQYILARLKAQKSLLKQAHETTRYEKLDDVHMLQAGIFWAGWLEQEIARLTKKAATVEADTTNFEADAFQHIDSMLERIG
jgi:transposase